jgi:hypothetical protein
MHKNKGRDSHHVGAVNTTCSDRQEVEEGLGEEAKNGP